MEHSSTRRVYEKGSLLSYQGVTNKFILNKLVKTEKTLLG